MRGRMMRTRQTGPAVRERARAAKLREPTAGGLYFFFPQPRVREGPGRGAAKRYVGRKARFHPKQQHLGDNVSDNVSAGRRVATPPKTNPLICA